MNDFLDVIASHWYLPLLAASSPALLYAFLPGVFLHLGVLLYPKGHVKRAEFIGELGNVPYRERPKWVAGNLAHCLFEGPPARIQKAREARRLSKIREQVGSVVDEIDEEIEQVAKDQAGVLAEALANLRQLQSPTHPDGAAGLSRQSTNGHPGGLPSNGRWVTVEDSYRVLKD